MKKTYINPECDVLILENAEETMLTVSGNEKLSLTNEGSNPWNFDV